ncbi:MAG: cobyrinate a,c-diamide synthase [Neomegalonema sp.]|nr:cobyrinate a,c-diamide synthase [Neomegalonema sp.]
MKAPHAIVVASAASSAGKTTVALGLIRALRDAGFRVAAAKCGPDYIDPGFLTAAAGGDAGAGSGGAINLDAFAMSEEDLRARATLYAERRQAEILVVEGAMGLFDGALDANGQPAVGVGATAQLAAALQAPTLLVVGVAARAQSAIIDPIGAAAALAAWRADAPPLCGVVLNGARSAKHAALAQTAIEAVGFECFGALPHAPSLELPARHLGLGLATERPDLEAFLTAAGQAIASHIDIERIVEAAAPLARAWGAPAHLAPLGQRIAVAADQAFAFAYPHMLEDWRSQGAELRLFSPLADEAPDPAADAIFLPGGYPELHGAALSKAARFGDGVRAAAARNVPIYGECGGYMTLGEAMIDGEGRRWPMLGLLPLTTRMTPRRTALGYRRLDPLPGGPFKGPLRGHEFHYAKIEAEGAGARLFRAADATGADLGEIGLRKGATFGSFAHLIAPSPSP